MNYKFAIATRAVLISMTPLLVAAGQTTFHSQLTAVVGQGKGTVQGATTAEDHGTLAVHGVVAIQRTTPNTVFTVERLLDPTPDGDCANAGPPPLTLTTIGTSAGGAGAGNFELHTPAPSGIEFDI